MISSDDKKFYAQMRTQCLELALIMAKAFHRWNKAEYKGEMDFYYQQAKGYERRMNRATMML